MRVEGDRSVCAKCGNGARPDKYYGTPRAWFDLERKRVYRQILDRGFELREKVKLDILPKYEYLKKQATSLIAGEGTKGNFLEFFPKRETTATWLFATEEMHRLNGGTWKNFPGASTYVE